MIFVYFHSIIFMISNQLIIYFLLTILTLTYEFLIPVTALLLSTIIALIVLHILISINIKVSAFHSVGRASSPITKLNEVSSSVFSASCNRGLKIVDTTGTWSTFSFKSKSESVII